MMIGRLSFTGSNASGGRSRRFQLGKYFLRETNLYEVTSM